jgi:hypothetical protein
MGHSCVLVLLYLGLNVLYKKEIIDPRNKAYGLNYIDKSNRPIYDRETIRALASDSNIAADKKYFLGNIESMESKTENCQTNSLHHQHQRRRREKRGVYDEYFATPR